MAVLFRTRVQAGVPPACERCHEPMRCMRIERDKVFWRCSFCFTMTYVYIKAEMALANRERG